MLKHKIIMLFLGALLLVESVFMFVAVAISTIYSEIDFQFLLISAIITFLVGLLLVIPNFKIDKKVDKRESYLIVSLAWIVLSLFGSLPFFISGYIPNFTDAFFETMSGFTTTGASILDNIESLPHGLLFWRSLTQWIGGMGIIVLSIATIPIVKSGGMQLFVAEVPGISTDKLHPRIKGTAKKLWLVYISLTFILSVLLFFSGMDWFDAINHAFTTMATGGYSTKQASIAYWSAPSIHYIILVFMILSGINYSVLYFGLTGKIKKLIKNTEVKFYLFLIISLSSILALGLWFYMDLPIEKSIRDSFFQVASVMTTTGFSTNDYTQWHPNGLWLIILVVMLIGGSSGSTSGGIKVVRIHVLLRNSILEFKRLLFPNAVLPVRYNKLVLSEKTVNSVLAFVILYAVLIVLGTIVLSFTDLDFTSSLGAVVASISNVGPALGSFGPSASFSEISIFGKWLLSFMMLVGRLELFTVMILFTKTFWRK
ncbi:MAG: TrkH family potassium uptake protein [Bacteroidales bacterium]|jgi:trk system potassium uptake protein TrkH|nr:TrkH family potassium uptake protein [Bacteroidales bacterium]MCK9499434.1 TrkH family potassium uptake protein [Bacteroidales bacterium]MDY0313926.1 potassium transporter TrkG [Bacteroidales bacterium]NLB86808.1 TrkH family potassium uptake protein [Bacteroidales bacterium]